jgi:hypothetical protein
MTYHFHPGIKSTHGVHGLLWHALAPTPKWCVFHTTLKELWHVCRCTGGCAVSGGRSHHNQDVFVRASTCANACKACAFFFPLTLRQQHGSVGTLAAAICRSNLLQISIHNKNSCCTESLVVRQSRRWRKHSPFAATAANKAAAKCTDWQQYKVQLSFCATDSSVSVMASG